MPLHRSMLWVLLLPLLTLGCYGQSSVFQTDDPLAGDGAAPEVPNVVFAPQPVPSACVPGQVLPGELPLQRLTRDQYDHVVADLLGVTSRPAAAFPPEEEVFGFDNIAAAHQPSQLLTDKYLAAAERVSNEADLSKVLPCALDTTAQDSCAADFISGFGAKAFRRSLDEDERTRLFAVYLAGKGRVGFAGGIRWTLQAMLQSPHFLYRVEFGEPSGEEDVVALTPEEQATRLSFLLWQSVPDEALLEAARTGELATPAGVETQARRMLSDPRARRAVNHFHKQWLQLESLAEANKDAAVYPTFAGLKPDFQRETETFLDHVFWTDGRAESLFLPEVAFLNEKLATFYGASGVSGTELTAVAPPAGRAGILTQGAFLAAHAKPNASSPVHRGKFIREQLLCTQLPPPPDDVPTASDPDPSLTTRERFAAHSADAACSGCHNLIDPLGFGLEAFDGEGRFRATEAGRPVDATGRLEGGGETVDGDYDGAVALSEKLSKSPVVMECIATQWFRFAYGRLEQSVDACSQERVAKTFADSGYDLRELLVSLTQTDAFLYRHRIVPGASAPGGSP